MAMEGMVWKMNPFEMPRAFCVGEYIIPFRLLCSASPFDRPGTDTMCSTSTNISARSRVDMHDRYHHRACALDVLCDPPTSRRDAGYSCLHVSLCPHNLARTGDPDSVSNINPSRSQLRWNPWCLVMAVVPLTAFLAYLILLLRFDAVQPADGLNCDAMDPVWYVNLNSAEFHCAILTILLNDIGSVF